MVRLRGDLEVLLGGLDDNSEIAVPRDKQYSATSSSTKQDVNAGPSVRSLTQIVALVRG